MGAGLGKVKGSKAGFVAGWVGVGVAGLKVVDWKVVKGLEVGGKAEGVGAGVAGRAAPEGAASSLTRTSSPLGKA